MSNDPYPEPDPTLSRDAADSTYAPAPEPKNPDYPASAPGVEQTLGKPTGAQTSARRSTSRESSS